MSTLQKFVPPAALLGLSSASFLTAYIASFTLVTVPSIETGTTKESATSAAQQWRRAFKLGRTFAPPFAITCAACFTFLAVQTRGIVGRYPISPSALYTTAAILAPSIVPYTIAVMAPSTLRPLEAKATGEGSVPGDQETLDLIKKWSAQNVVRAGLAGTAAVISAFAILAQVA
ncbi:hypothetical protein Slin14017_G056760 [Septoria linicola]|nr:hypothetical protein Slin14017_G056760 [Septoria linicola]